MESSSSSSAYRSPLLDIGLSKCTPLRSIFGFSHPAPASRLAQVIAPPCLRTSYTTFAEAWSPLVIGSSANMASPLPLQLAEINMEKSNIVLYIDNYQSTTYHLRLMNIVSIIRSN
ncbi:hypothetical protein B5X24_HaOG212218 [Helicoverpa armigera]|nr:hypothetical protein B5X24_HaOG212218 [Helicoverpa armigera]